MTIGKGVYIESRWPTVCSPEMIFNTRCSSHRWKFDQFAEDFTLNEEDTEQTNQAKRRTTRETDNVSRTLGQIPLSLETALSSDQYRGGSLRFGDTLTQRLTVNSRDHS